MGGFLVDGFGIFLILSSVKLLLALSFDLYHSTDFDVHRNWLRLELFGHINHVGDKSEMWVTK